MTRAALKLSETLGGLDDTYTRPTLSAVFEEEPVPLQVFITDKAYLNNPPLSDEQFKLVQHVERIYYQETLDLMAEEFGGYWAGTRDIRMVNLITAQWGKGGGKDHTTRIAHLRVTYLALCLISPQAYYGMPEQDSIHLLNIAANSGQANRAFFKPMTNAVKRGWFKDRAEPKRDTIDYDKHIEAISGHSDAESQEGMNILLGVADEIDAFKSRSEMGGLGKQSRESSTSAESILEMLKTSASTRFPDVYKRVAISFPRYLGSTIQRLTAEGKADMELMGEKSREFVSGPFATWEVNPRISGKEKYADDYRKDPLAAAAKYECKPSRASDAYFRNMELFLQAVDRPAQPLRITYKASEVKSAFTQELTKTWEPEFHFDPDFLPVSGARYAMHADLAVKGDRAGIGMSHILRWEERTEVVEDEDGITSEVTSVVPIVKNDFTIAFEADSAAVTEDGTLMPREIQIRWARLLVFQLIKRGFPVVRFTFDNFQSIDSIQILNRHGVESKKVSLDVNDNVWKAVKDVVSDGRLLMAHDDLLLKELTGLSRVNNKVDHEPGGSKDLADGFAGSIAGALESGGEEDAAAVTVELSESMFETGSVDAPFEGAGSLYGDAGSVPMGMKGFGFG